jgi:hypothetical protein
VLSQCKNQEINEIFFQIRKLSSAYSGDSTRIAKELPESHIVIALSTIFLKDIKN